MVKRKASAAALRGRAKRVATMKSPASPPTATVSATVPGTSPLPAPAKQAPHVSPKQPTHVSPHLAAHVSPDLTGSQSKVPPQIEAKQLEAKKADAQSINAPMLEGLPPAPLANMNSASLPMQQAISQLLSQQQQLAALAQSQLAQTQLFQNQGVGHLFDTTALLGQQPLLHPLLAGGNLLPLLAQNAPLAPPSAPKPPVVPHTMPGASHLSEGVQRKVAGHAFFRQDPTALDDHLTYASNRPDVAERILRRVAIGEFVPLDGFLQHIGTTEESPFVITRLPLLLKALWAMIESHKYLFPARSAEFDFYFGHLIEFIYGKHTVKQLLYYDHAFRKGIARKPHMLFSDDFASVTDGLPFHRPDDVIHHSDAPPKQPVPNAPVPQQRPPGPQGVPQKGAPPIAKVPQKGPAPNKAGAKGGPAPGKGQPRGTRAKPKGVPLSEEVRARQICHKYNLSRCQEPCPLGRIHDEALRLSHVQRLKEKNAKFQLEREQANAKYEEGQMESETRQVIARRDQYRPDQYRPPSSHHPDLYRPDERSGGPLSFTAEQSHYARPSGGTIEQ